MKKLLMLAVVLSLFLTSCAGKQYDPPIGSTTNTNAVSTSEKAGGGAQSSGSTADFQTQPPVIKDESERRSDTVLNISEIKLDDFDRDYSFNFLLIINNGGKGHIYRLYGQNKYTSSIQDPHIEYYETDTITADFFCGMPLNVNKAVKNIVSIYDCMIFNNRFNSVKTVDLSSAEAMLKSPGRHVLLISLETGRAFNGTNAALGSALYGDISKSDDYGLVELMLLLFEDRGFSFQHF